MTTDYGGFDVVRALVLQPDGKLVAGGSKITGEEVSAGVSVVFDFAPARYLNTSDAIAVIIDSKPGSFPHTINPKSHGVISVAILTTDILDATTVDPLSVRIGPNEAQEAHSKGHIEDVNQDGEIDSCSTSRSRP